MGPSHIAAADVAMEPGRDEVWGAAGVSPQLPTAFVRFAEGSLRRPD